MQKLRANYNLLDWPVVISQKQNTKLYRILKPVFMIIIMAISLLCLMENAFARYDDSDGHLKIYWSPPGYGNTVQSYIWSYIIISVSDSLTGVSPSDARCDSSVILSSPGDWAVFSIRAISVLSDTSISVISDTAYFASCRYVVGDANNSGTLNGLDATYSVNFFKGGDPPPYMCECTPDNSWFVAGDVNNSCSFNGLDVTYLVNYFKGGPAPEPCSDCPSAR